ncbi:kinase-like protein [Gymnopus androsaceus JB14]|uniref:Kinase-like protein n=1 Tax=Gymnopus androsaceus JB14 TaxID=1447944 RepID=A0A6A4HTI8_9AGAR|nr:kinase-like protein [Gymnopus androsaceus JB14]
MLKQSNLPVKEPLFSTLGDPETLRTRLKLPLPTPNAPVRSVLKSFAALALSMMPIVPPSLPTLLPTCSGEGNVLLVSTVDAVHSSADHSIMTRAKRSVLDVFFEKYRQCWDTVTAAFGDVAGSNSDTQTQTAASNTASSQTGTPEYADRKHRYADGIYSWSFLSLLPLRHFFHVDFGYILGRDPEPFPPAVQVCKEMVMAWRNSVSSIHVIQIVLFTAFTILRKSANLILNFVTLMVDASIPDIKHRDVHEQIQEKFRLDLMDEETSLRMRGIFAPAPYSARYIRTRRYDRVAAGQGHQDVNRAQELRISKDSSIKKKERLQALLADSKNNLCSMPPLPLPLNAQIEITGIIPEKSSIFKSAMYPFCSPSNARWNRVPSNIQRRGRHAARTACALTPYAVLTMGPMQGMAQFVPSKTIAALVSEYGNVLSYLRAGYPDEGSVGTWEIEPGVIDAFVRSCAGYCVITYLLGVGDQHLDSLLVAPDGHFFHVDFGYILGRDPEPFPPAIKVCKEMVDGMGGTHANLILNFVTLMVDASIPDIKHRDVHEQIQEKFRLDLTEEELPAHKTRRQGVKKALKGLFWVVLTQSPFENQNGWEDLPSDTGIFAPAPYSARYIRTRRYDRNLTTICARRAVGVQLERRVNLSSLPLPLPMMYPMSRDLSVSLWLPLQWAILSYYTHLHSLKDAAPSFIQYQQFQQSPDLDEPDKSFLLVALDLLSGLTQHGVQASHDLWQSQPNLLTLLTICFKHPQAACSTIHDLASYMPGIIGLKRGFTQG